MDPADSSSDVNMVSSDEPSSSPARDSGNSSSDVNVVSSGDEPTDNSSDLNVVGSTGSAPSSTAAKDSDDRSSNVAAGEPSSSVAKDSSDTSSDANNVVAPSRDEPSSSASRGSTSSERSVDVASGYTCDELIFHALYTITENHDGNGLDINGIFEYHRGRPGLPENFMDLLKYELRKLVIEGQIEKVGNLYKIPTGAITPEGSEMPQEQPSTSHDVPSMPSIPIDENQEKVDEAVRLVAVAEDCEIQAKEAVEQADRSVELLHESRKNELLAVEISRRCARGEKVYLR